MYWKIWYVRCIKGMLILIVRTTLVLIIKSSLKWSIGFLLVKRSKINLLNFGRVKSVFTIPLPVSKPSEPSGETLTTKYFKQESIPVGCVQAVYLVLGGGLSYPPSCSPHIGRPPGCRPPREADSPGGRPPLRQTPLDSDFTWGRLPWMQTHPCRQTPLQADPSAGRPPPHPRRQTPLVMWPVMHTEKQQTTWYSDNHPGILLRKPSSKEIRSEKQSDKEQESILVDCQMSAFLTVQTT